MSPTAAQIRLWNSLWSRPVFKAAVIAVRHHRREAVRSRFELRAFHLARADAISLRFGCADFLLRFDQA